MILVIGSSEEYHSRHVYELLKSKGENVCYFDSRTIPERLPITWVASDNTIKGSLKIDGQKINLKDIKSVYWRWHYGIDITPADKTYNSRYIAHMIIRETISAIDSLFSVMDCLWVNSLDAIEMHKKKTYQLYVMAKNGIRVPKSLITNDRDEVMSFFDENNGQLIYKPVRGGASTEKLKTSDFTEERLNSLKISPVQFQEFIDGVDIRVYVIKDKIFAAEIHAKTIDFRDDRDAKIVPIELPENIKDDCLKIMKLLNLNFSGIDIRCSHTGEYVFIEANPSPMFAFFENKSGYPISEGLAELLIKGK
ncbi:MAG: ATP-grasp domain-containing protein [Candidatus Gastranaerophilales bacterium]|nr:ATP-grasp domain-containing protein [Candidatus Gastranaerophilales bacterium]